MKRCHALESRKATKLMALYQRLVRDVFLPLSLWRAGEVAQLRYLREFERTQWLSADALQSLQLARLRTLLHHAYEQCPFYRQRFDQARFHPDDFRALTDLRRLPPSDKRAIQD